MTFLCLAVQCSIIYTEMSICQNAVSRNLISCLQQHQVANYNVIRIDHTYNTISVYFTLLFFYRIFQIPVFRIAGHTGSGRHKSNHQNCHDGSQRFINLCITKEKHDDHQQCDRYQNTDHRILKSLPEFFPECGRL